MKRHIPLVVGEAESGLRLDQAIAQLCPELSRGEARRLIARGSVFVGRKRTKVAGRLVRLAQRLDVYPGDLVLPEAHSGAVAPIPIIHETPHLLVMDKPSGLMSAPTPESDQHDALSLLTRVHGPLYLVHRLDRPTSGLMLLARSREAAADLSRQLADRTLSRQYLAILGGHPGDPGTKREVHTPLAGQEASTEFEFLAQSGPATLTRVRLATGRTHQIRLHALELMAPVVGDSKYGRLQLRGFPRAPRLALHAERLTFRDPETREEVTLISPFPEILQSYFDGLC